MPSFPRRLPLLRRHSGLSQGQSGHELEQPEGLCISIKELYSPGFAEGPGWQGAFSFLILIAPFLDSKNLVQPYSSTTVLSTSIITSSESVPFSSVSGGSRVHSVSSQPRRVLSDGLASYRHTLQDRGFSESVVKTILARRGESTYKSITSAGRPAKAGFLNDNLIPFQQMSWSF